MLSKNKLKYIRSLSQKKYRDINFVFKAEGPKVVEDLMGYFDCELLLGTKSYLDLHPNLKAQEVIEVDQNELEQASSLKSPRDTIAVFSKKRLLLADRASNKCCQPLILALDDIQDPGNLGTIIRLADWYGIQHIYCSKNCADVYSAKVIQATMGAIARVDIHYVDLTDYIQSKVTEFPIYGTFLDGEDLYQKNLSKGGVIVMGNEGNGISSELKALITNKLYIPNYPKGQSTSESLNVAIATAITCAEFRRQSKYNSETI